MMRKLAISLAAVTLVCVGISLAQDSRPARPGPGPGPMEPGQLMDRLVKELGLTADQQTQVKQILEAHRKAMEELRKQLGDGAASRPSREDMQKFAAQREEITKKALDQLKAVLTDDQKAKLAKLDVFGGPRPPLPEGERLIAALDKLDLTADQKDQIAKLLADARKAAEAATEPKDKAEAFRTALEGIKKVLTADQLKKLEELLRPPGDAPLGPFARLNLTDDQKQSILKIMGDAREQAKDATPQQREEILRAAREKIVKEVLTDEQRKQLPERPVPGPADRPLLRPAQGDKPATK